MGSPTEGETGRSRSPLFKNTNTNQRSEGGGGSPRLRGLDLALVRALDICAIELAREVAQAEEICARLKPENAPGQLTAEMFRRRVAAVRYELDELRQATQELVATAVAELAECEQAPAVEFVARHRDHATDRVSLVFDAGHGKQERLQLWVANGRIGFDDDDRRRIQLELRKAHEAELLARASAYQRGTEAGSGLQRARIVTARRKVRHRRAWLCAGCRQCVAEPMTVAGFYDMVALRIAREGTGCSRVFDLRRREVMELAADLEVAELAAATSTTEGRPMELGLLGATAGTMARAEVGALIAFAGQQIRVVGEALEAEPEASAEMEAR